MDNLLHNFSAVFCAALLSLTHYDFFEIFFKTAKRGSKKYLYFTLALHCAFSSLAVIFVTTPAFNLIVGPIIIFMITLYYKASMMSRIISVVFTYGLLTFFEIMPSLIITSLSDLSLAITYNGLTDTGLFLLSFYLARLLPFVILKIYKHHVVKNNKYPKTDININFKDGVLFALPPFGGMVLAYYLVEVAFGEVVNQYYILIVLSLVLTFIFVFYIAYLKHLEYAELRSKEFLLDKQIENYALHYDELKTNLSEFYIYKHNIKHKLLEIMSELNIDEKTVLQKFDLTFKDELDYNYYSNNKAIDMMLNYIVGKAKHLNVNVKIKVEPNLIVNVDESTISVILGNILDNAIEACSRFGKKEFLLEIKSQNSNLVIITENAYDGEIEFIDGLPKTSKNQKGHGIGLKSVEKLILDAGGILQIDASNGIFLLQILLINAKVV